jgi:hypothetical protein
MKNQYFWRKQTVNGGIFGAVLSRFAPAYSIWELFFGLFAQEAVLVHQACALAVALLKQGVFGFGFHIYSSFFINIVCKEASNI